MGRRSEGWKIREKNGTLTVRFTLGGKPYEFSTGVRRSERDPRKAQEAAERIYADAVAGYRRRRKTAASQVVDAPLDEKGAEWIASLRGSKRDNTRKTYEMYVFTHLVPFFRTTDQITTEGAQEYIRYRLRSAMAETVRKEVSALRMFCDWYFGPEGAPKIPGVPKKSAGTKYKKKRRTKPPELTPQEVARMFDLMPERSKGRWPIRDRFIFAYETSLRPGTVDKLSVPENYVKGDTHLVLWEEDDKGRWQRRIPLSDAARKALERSAPEKGLIFGRHDYRTHIHAAAKALPRQKRAAFCGAHLRSARITHWLEESDNLMAVQYLAGHKTMQSTQRYVRPSQRAAEALLAELGKSG